MLNDINFFATYKCNSKCQNCHIWKTPGPENKKKLEGQSLEKLLNDPLFKNCANIGFAGGEPTLSPFFWKMADQFASKGKHITITTNALSSKRLKEFLDASDYKKNYLVQLSLDGIGQINDTIRGVNGAYNKTLDLLYFLKNIDVNRLLSFTINQLNFHQILDCYNLAKDFEARFSTRMAYCGGAYANKDSQNIFDFGPENLNNLSKSIERIVFSEFENPHHSPASLVFMNKIVDYAKGRQNDLPCMAMDSGMVIDCYGDVFPNCPVMMTSIGSLHEKSLSEIWAGEKAKKARKKIAAFACGGCWNDCQVPTNIEHDKNFLTKEYTRLKADFLKDQNLPQKLNLKKNILLLNGWYEREGNENFIYRWTQPKCAFFLPKGVSGLNICLTPPPRATADDKNVLDVFLDGRLMQTINISAEWNRYVVQFDSPTKDLSECAFKLNRYYCPKEAGISMDGRHLGIGVHEIDFIQA